MFARVWYTGMMFDEMTKSTKAALYERATNPFTGAFVVSFLVYYWEIPACLLAKNAHLSLITAVDEVSGRGLSFVFAFAVTASIILPYLGLGLSKIRSHALTHTRELQKKTRDGELLSRSQGEELRQELAKRLEAIRQLEEESISLNQKLESAIEARDTAVGERDGLRAERDAILAERESLYAEFLGFVRASFLRSMTIRGAKVQELASSKLKNRITPMRKLAMPSGLETKGPFQEKVLAVPKMMEKIRLAMPSGLETKGPFQEKVLAVPKMMEKIRPGGTE